MKALVTGANGFVGRNLVRSLLSQGHSVKALVRTKRETFPCEQVIGDVTDASTLAGACSGVDVIFHLAGSVDESLGHDKLYELNTLGTKNMLEAAPKRLKRFVFLSSSGGETTYERTKRDAEELVRQSGVPGTVIRSTIIYGPGNANWKKIMDAARKFPIFGDGKNKWELIYVDDVCEALIKAARSETAAGETYTISDGGKYTYEDVYNTVREVAHDLGPQKNHIPVALAKLIALTYEIKAALTGRKTIVRRAHIDRLVRERSFDITSAKQDLKWAPKTSLKEGIKKSLVE